MRVLICGAGIAGLTLAGLLQRQRHEVLVVERAPHLRDEGYMIDFSGSGYDASERLGLLPELERIHQPVARLTFVDARGRERASLPYPVLRERLLEGRHFNFMRGELARVLLGWLEGGAGPRFHTTVESFEQRGEGVHARLSDGSEGDFDLLVGADGVHSRIRQLAFGPEERFARFVGCHTAAFILERPPAGLRDSEAFTTLTVPGRQVSLYRIRGGRLATLFIHRAAHPAGDCSREAALRELRTVYGDLDWLVPEVLEHAPEAPGLYFDDVTQIELPHWSTGRVVLLGDACQCVSLLAGQGASMAVAGAYVLAEELEAAGGDVPAALTRYQQRLQPVITRMQAAGRRMAGWFVPASPWSMALRDAGLRMALWPVLAPLLRRRMAAASIFRR